jgi:hypothetical protein
VAALTSAVNASIQRFPTDTPNPAPGSYYTIDDENIVVLGAELSGTQGGDYTVWVVERGAAGTTAASHLSGAPLTRYYPEAPGLSGTPDGSGSIDLTINATATGSGEATAENRATSVNGDASVSRIAQATGSGAAYAETTAEAVAGDAGATQTATTSTGSAYSEVNANVQDAGGTATVELAATGVAGQISLRLQDDGTVLHFNISGLPTANPNVAGDVWIDTGAGRVLKVSAG